MNERLEGIRRDLAQAKTERGRLTQIASACNLSYRTLYGVMCQQDKTPSAATIDKLAAYFKKARRKAGQA